MAKSSHEQSARATILNSNRPEPLADSGLDRQKVTTRESTQRTSNGDQNIKKLCGPLMANLKKTQVQSTIAQKVLYDLNEKIKEVRDSEKIKSEPNALFH
jgi:hypothetical protein